MPKPKANVVALIDMITIILEKIKDILQLIFQYFNDTYAQNSCIKDINMPMTLAKKNKTQEMTTKIDGASLIGRHST